MSLIDRSLKAAQREKSRLDAQGGRPFAPVLVRLRVQPRQGLNRAYLLAAGGTLAAIVLLLVWMKGFSNEPLPAVPPVTSTILSEALALDSSRAERPTVQQAATSPTDAAAPPGSRVAVASSPRMDTETVRSRDTRGVSGATPAPVRPAETALAPPLRSAPLDRSGAARAEGRSLGGLRIAVEQPRDGDAVRLFREAVTAHRAGDVARARALYERVLALSPNDADALNNLGVILSADREFDRALGLLRRAASIAPRNAGVWNNIGAALREQAKAADAIAAFRHALSIDPAHQGARVGLAQQYLAMNSLSQAKELLGQALIVNPSLAEAHYTLGQVLELQGDRFGAIASYSSFLRVAPARLGNHAELVRRRIDALSSEP